MIIFPMTEAHSSTIKIGIIDTGLLPYSSNLKLCPTGHYDFDSHQSVIAYSGQKHGTIIAAIIADQLVNVDYCVIIYQVSTIFGINPEDIAKAVRMAKVAKVFAINISLSGPDFNKNEQNALRDLAESGTKIFIAAGNEKTDLSINCNAYPACYNQKNTTIVGALQPTGYFRADYSNYGKGKVTAWYNGDYTWQGIYDHGTSYASPKALSAYVLSHPVRSTQTTVQML